VATDSPIGDSIDSALDMGSGPVPTTIAELKALHTTEIEIPLSTGEVAVAPEPVAESVESAGLGEYELDQMPTRRGRQRGVVSSVPEPVAMLTPDRVLEVTREIVRPEGFPNNAIYWSTLGLVNRGDSPAVLHRKATDLAMSRRFQGGSRYIPVLTRKGGVGKTTTTALLGMALARVREDRVIAIDANPDRGTLAERFPKSTDKTVRDVVSQASSIHSFTDFSDYISRDRNRLDVLASDTDPLLSEAFDENDYNVVADIVSKYYSVVLTDCGTGIVHSVMKATLERADGLVIVSGGSFDEARLAAETLTWLESNGYADLVRKSVVSINTATQGTNLVNLNEIENHFKSRVREIVRMPYDPVLAAGSVIEWDRLKTHTRAAARELAALVMDGLE
jgi:MinD-like ATPase involved in chromosome partitioning or flagellar assembly